MDKDYEWHHYNKNFEWFSSKKIDDNTLMIKDEVRAQEVLVTAIQNNTADDLWESLVDFDKGDNLIGIDYVELESVLCDIKDAYLYYLRCQVSPSEIEALSQALDSFLNTNNKTPVRAFLWMCGDSSTLSDLQESAEKIIRSKGCECVLQFIFLEKNTSCHLIIACQ